MSLTPLQCCDVDSVHARTRPFPPGQSTTYAVYWRCPRCGALSADLGSLLMPDAEARKAVGSAPADPVVAARAAFDQGLVRRAFTLLDLALEAAPGSAAALAEQGRELFHAGFSASAVASLERARAAGDVSTSTSGLLGVALTDTPRLGEALPLLQDAVAGDADSGMWRHGLVRLLVRLQRYDAAEQELARAPLDRVGDFWRAGLLTEKVNVLCARRNATEALAVADEAVRLAPQATYGHFVRGRALGMLGRLDEAEAEMDRILAMAPADPDATSAKQAFARARRR